MSSLKAGFAKVNITPELGIHVHGYYIPRYAKGILDELEAAALALELGETRVLLISVDNEGIRGYNASMRDIDQPTDVLSFPGLYFVDPSFFFIPEEEKADYITKSNDED